MNTASVAAPLRVFWQPGCTGCLRTKEFLRSRDVDFESVNVLTDDGYAEFMKLGARQLPIVARGATWVNGLDFSGVSRLAGLRWSRLEQLPPDILALRALTVLDKAQSLLGQVPEQKLDDKLPARPRTYRELGSHIFQIFSIFLDYLENGKPVTWDDYNAGLPPEIRTTAELFTYCSAVRERFSSWWEAHQGADFTQEVTLYYGKRSLHDFLERTTWHSMQHARQLQLVLETLGIGPKSAIGDADMAGLPLPNHIFDDEIKFASGAGTNASAVPI